MNSNREKIIVRTSIISIILNIVLVGFKALVGIFANSIAIVSDAINNLSDVISSIIAIAGTKFAAKEPDKNHPYGHGRIEYMAFFCYFGNYNICRYYCFYRIFKKNNKA